MPLTQVESQATPLLSQTPWSLLVMPPLVPPIRRGAAPFVETGRRGMGMQDLMSLGIVLHETPELHGQALKLASQLGPGAAYDAHYMVLAENLGCELWTADRRFHRAAEAAGNVHWIGEWAAQD